MENIKTLTKFQLKINRNKIIGWTIAIFLITAIYMGFYESLEELAEVKLSLFPPSIMKLMDLSSLHDISNYNSYFKMILSFIIIAISIYATTFASSLVVKKEENKTIEYYYSLPLSKMDIAISNLLTGLISLIPIVAVIIIPTTYFGIFDGINTYSFTITTKALFFKSLIPILFMLLSFIISNITSNLGKPSVTSLLVVFTYIFGYISKLLEDKGEMLKYLSPFEVFEIYGSLYTMAAYILISLLLYMGSLLVYKKRDFQV